MTNPTTPAGAGKDETTKWLSAERKAELRASNIGIVDCGPPDSRSYATAGEVLALLAELAAVTGALEQYRHAVGYGTSRAIDRVIEVREQAREELASVNGLAAMEEWRRKYLGVNGMVYHLHEVSDDPSDPIIQQYVGDVKREACRWFDDALAPNREAHAQSLATDIRAECRALADGTGKAGEDK